MIVYRFKYIPLQIGTCFIHVYVQPLCNACGLSWYESLAALLYHSHIVYCLVNCVDTAAHMLDPQTMINMINNQGRQTKAAMSHKDSLCDLSISENGEGRSGRLFDLWMVSSVYKQRVASFQWFDGYKYATCCHYYCHRCTCTCRCESQ